MLKFYPSRFALLTDALVGLLALAVVVFLGVQAIPFVNPYLIAAVLGPFAVGFLGLVIRAVIWLVGRLATLEASEELFTLRRRWGQKIVVRWTEVAEIRQAVIESPKRPNERSLSLRFVTNSGRFEGPLDIAQARLKLSLREVVANLVDRTMARYVLVVDREPPAEWRRQNGPSWILAGLSLVVLSAVALAACWYAGIFG